VRGVAYFVFEHLSLADVCGGGCARVRARSRKRRSERERAEEERSDAHRVGLEETMRE
jgi:hypothetical protein